MQLGQAAAQHAIALDSTLADAWAALGLVRMYLQWDWAGAESALKRAIDLSPSFGEIRWHYSYLLLLSDRTGEAIAEGQQAHDLDPFNLAIGSDLVIQYLLRGRREEAAKLARELLKVPGRRSEAHGRAWDALGLALTAQGNYAEAIQAADSGRKLNPGLTSNLVYSLVKAGRVDSARAVLFTYERTPLTAITAFNRAVMHGLVGDNDGFFRWIRYEPHHAWLPWIRVLPEFAPPSVQRDPRFALEMRRMNLPMPRR
jgi:tetratricopeptide (TPR) repeat protein